MRVTYNGRTWEARWWTQNQAPGTNEVWLDRGPCGGGGPTSASPKCRQAHTALVGWEPATTPALWLPV